MHSWAELRDKCKQIRTKLEAECHGSSSDLLLGEVRERLSRVEEMLTVREDSARATTSEGHPLGTHPYLCVQILFQLNRCEDLLSRFKTESKAGPDYPLDPTRLLYPSAVEALLMRVFSFLIYCRGRALNYDACYDTPLLREILYLKSPFWLSPFLSLFLPRSRRDWRYLSRGRKRPTPIRSQTEVSRVSHRGKPGPVK